MFLLQLMRQTRDHLKHMNTYIQAFCDQHHVHMSVIQACCYWASTEATLASHHVLLCVQWRCPVLVVLKLNMSNKQTRERQKGTRNVRSANGNLPGFRVPSGANIQYANNIGSCGFFHRPFVSHRHRLSTICTRNILAAT